MADGGLPFVIGAPQDMPLVLDFGFFEKVGMILEDF